MEKIKVICYSVALALIFTKSHAQKIDENLFKSLCKEIALQDRYQKIINNLKGDVVLVEDPITGEQAISFSTNSSEVNDFKKRPKKQQFEILNSIELPNLPLKDTVLIIDNNGILSNVIMKTTEGRIFKSVSKDEDRISVSKVILKSLLIRGDDFIITCTFPNDSMACIYYFTLNRKEFSTKRLSSIDMNDKHFKQ